MLQGVSEHVVTDCKPGESHGPFCFSVLVVVVISFVADHAFGSYKMFFDVIEDVLGHPFAHDAVRVDQ